MYHQINNTKTEIVNRISSNECEFDWLMGYTDTPLGRMWGTPVGKLILLAGEAGVGKSRLSASLVQGFSRQGLKVAYIQTEADNSCHHLFPTNFNCFSIDKDLATQIQDIREHNPDVVFIDSINNMDDYGSGSANNVKTIIDAYREVGNELNCTVIFLGQLNSDGSVKGSSTLLHLPDIVLHAENTKEDGQFTIRVGNKHRYGRTGNKFTSNWEHNEFGVTCTSFHRLASNDNINDVSGCDKKYLNKESLRYFSSCNSVEYNGIVSQLKQLEYKEQEVVQTKAQSRRDKYLNTPAKQTPVGARMPINQLAFDGLDDISKRIYMTYGVPGVQYQTQEENDHYLNSIVDWKKLNKINKKADNRRKQAEIVGTVVDGVNSIVQFGAVMIGSAIVSDKVKKPWI